MSQYPPQWQQPPFPQQPNTWYPPPQPPPNRRSFKQWYTAQDSFTKLGLGCGSLMVIVSMCLCAAVASANGSVLQQTAQPTPTATTAVLVAQDTPTDTPIPTDIPTATPSPTATPIPTSTSIPTPKPVPTQPPKPTPTPAPHCSGINNNPWCYDFNPGKLIYVPPNGFCGYFSCIPTFYGSDDPGDGYIIECSDGSYSQSGGESGACSYHGGELRPLYAH